MAAIFLMILAIGWAAARAQAPEVDLATLAANPSAYRGQIVRTCGWARNAFEDQSISVARNPYDKGGRPNPGLEVDWPERARHSDAGQAEWRCIAGRIEPTCGDIDPEDAEKLCISTASPYRWKIVEGAQ